MQGRFTSGNDLLDALEQSGGTLWLQSYNVSDDALDDLESRGLIDYDLEGNMVKVDLVGANAETSLPKPRRGWLTRARAAKV